MNGVIDFAANPLIPAVIQDDLSGDVLMVGFMNQPAFDRTLETGLTHFWSRSRKKLWMKGETSGHKQEVVSIALNCEQNSLLIKVMQTGAVCHEGYDTCFYREIDGDGTLRLARERAFDPSDIYNPDRQKAQLWYKAFEHLKNHDISAVSRTSAVLHEIEFNCALRAVDELVELSGALGGGHRHRDLESDLLLEGSQALYWIALTSIKSGFSFEDVRPDLALRTISSECSIETSVALLNSLSIAWTRPTFKPSSAVIHEAMALVAQSVTSAGLEPARLLDRELAEMRLKPYLADYFASAAMGA